MSWNIFLNEPCFSINMLLTMKICFKCTPLSFQKYPRNKTHDTQNSEPDNKKEKYLLVSMKDINLVALPYPSDAKCLQLERHLDDCIIMIRNGVRRTRVHFLNCPVKLSNCMHWFYKGDLQNPTLAYINTGCLSRDIHNQNSGYKYLLWNPSECKKANRNAVWSYLCQHGRVGWTKQAGLSRDLRGRPTFNYHSENIIWAFEDSGVHSTKNK